MKGLSVNALCEGLLSGVRGRPQSTQREAFGAVLKGSLDATTDHDTPTQATRLSRSKPSESDVLVNPKGVRNRKGCC